MAAQGLTLAEFDRYLNAKLAEVQACLKEIDEVRARLDEVGKREIGTWQEQFRLCFPRVLSGRAELPPAFAALVARVEAEERTRLEGEIATLGSQVQKGHERMDALLAQAQAATQSLRQANPQLNDHEEKLKRQVVRYQNEYTQAFEQMDALERPFLGWLVNGGKISSLRKTQETAKKKQAKMIEQLRRVRQEWEADVQKAGDTQAELRQEWEKVGVEASEAQTRHDYVQANLATLAEQAGVQRVLEELTEPPDVPGQLGADLGELARRNTVRLAYEEGLRAVSLALGMTRGIGQGYKTFEGSVSKVLGEQRRYSLKQVYVRLPADVLQLNEIWQELRTKAKDDQYLAAHPLEFSRLVDETLKSRLTDEAIKSLFQRMGEALNRATKGWS